jgi:moderate conductance mechanosensitive channel
VLRILAGPSFQTSLTDQPTCAKQTDSFCHTVWTWTHVGWLASGSEWLLVRPFRILMIAVIAMVVRWVLHRMIKRFTTVRDADRKPTVLRPLAEKVNGTLRETGILSERRKQRAATLGSVLRNLVSFVIFSIAAMMILNELGVDLAPLLASAGIAGVAIGFGAQTLVKDVISGMFMLLEDQYGVGDLVDVGEVIGTVEAVGLRITTIRDAAGVLWYIPNGTVLRVGNKSQNWAMVTIDVPVGFGASVDDATAALDRAVGGMADEDDWSADLIEPPTVLGVQQITAEGAVLGVQAKTTSATQWAVGRELRRRIATELERAGITVGIDVRRFISGPPATDSGKD